jgi:Phage integrase family
MRASIPITRGFSQLSRSRSSQDDLVGLDLAPAGQKRNCRVRSLSPLGFQRPRQELPEHPADMALFSVATGLRQANVKDLEWQYVDLDRMHLWIPGSKHKNGKPHSVPLNEMALSVLRKLKGMHATRVFTFRGEPIVQVSTLAWRKALERAGIADFPLARSSAHVRDLAPSGRYANPRAPKARRLEDWRDGGALRACGTPRPCKVRPRDSMRCPVTFRQRQRRVQKDQRPDVSVKPLILLNFGGP